MLLPGDDIESLVQVTGTAECVGQVPGEQPGESMIARRVGTAEAVL